MKTILILVALLLLIIGIWRLVLCIKRKHYLSAISCYYGDQMIFDLTRVEAREPLTGELMHGLIDSWGREILPAVYDNVYRITNEPFIYIKKGELYGLLDVKGKEIVPFGKEDIFVNKDRFYNAKNGSDFWRFIITTENELGEKYVYLPSGRAVAYGKSTKVGIRRDYFLVFFSDEIFAFNYEGRRLATGESAIDEQDGFFIGRGVECDVVFCNGNGVVAGRNAKILNKNLLFVEDYTNYILYNKKGEKLFTSQDRFHKCDEKTFYTFEGEKRVFFDAKGRRK